MTARELQVMLDAAQRVGRDLGRIEAIKDASRLLLERIDRANDVRSRTSLQAARRAVEALTLAVDK